MAGIYVHIPYCRQKCHYCNFFSLATHKHRNIFTDALLAEAESRQNYLNGEKVHTIYFGGGTPSLLPTDHINHIIEKLKSLFDVDENAEITLEANPEDLQPAYLKALGSTGINRLSIGIQSFRDADLKYLHRNHDGKNAYMAVLAAKEYGFDKLTIDLIYGIPTLDEDGWIENIETFFTLELKHLSAYALTVEPRTALDYLIHKRKLQAVDEEQTARHFDILVNRMEKAGFVHYEISNFALPGHYSKHNSLYWIGGHYLGLGPSAHSYNGFSRQWNISNLSQYISKSAQPTVVQEKEILTQAQHYNEYVMTSIRTTWGTDLEHIEAVFGTQMAEYCLNMAKPYLKDGNLEKRGQRLFLTNKGKFFADGIAAALFAENLD